MGLMTQEEKDKYTSIIQSVLIPAFDGELDSWRKIKVTLMIYSKIEFRAKFSRRDLNTMQMTINDYDREVMELYRSLTGIQPVLRYPDPVVDDPEDDA